MRKAEPLNLFQNGNFWFNSGPIYLQNVFLPLLLNNVSLRFATGRKQIAENFATMENATARTVSTSRRSFPHGNRGIAPWIKIFPNGNIDGIAWFNCIGFRNRFSDCFINLHLFNPVGGCFYEINIF